MKKLVAVKTPEPASSVLEQAATSHKLHTQKLVLPLMGVISILFFLAYVRATPLFFAVAVGGALQAAANFWITNLKGTTKIFGRTFNLRSDLADTVRWLINLVVCDTLQFVLLGADPMLTAVIWTAMLIAAQADLFRSRYRRVVVIAGWVNTVLLLFYLDPHKPLPVVLLTAFGVGGVVFLFERVESFWTHEFLQRLSLETQAVETRLRMELIEREAQIGSQARSISHELNNMIMIIDMSMDDPSSVNFDRIRRSIELVKRINALVLKGSQSSAPFVTRSFEDIFADVEVLLIKDLVNSQSCVFSLDLGEGVRRLQVRERFGSLFFILRNLIRNGYQATEGKRAEHQTALLNIRAESVEGKILLIVEDNGCGMDEVTARRLQQGEMFSQKEDGHGLGFRFVLDECQRNGIQLTLASQPGAGTTVSLRIPISA